ncbi:hypothetical protein AVEN_7826-1 [Araneus ventricosus]|uniref:Uncharacterized protein n=1 Tax=Araneus ventricosus TaxID=182803 RepID=A0A4Y2F0Y3_ARAVE|nr:hypothetical protein AVEN_7826-1 [Araneus ventricosus]
MNQHRDDLSSLLGSSPLVLHGVNRLIGFGMVLLQGSSSSKIGQTSSGLAWAHCWVLAPQKSVSHLDGCPANGSKSSLVYSHLPLQNQRAKCLFVLSSVA